MSTKIYTATQTTTQTKDVSEVTYDSILQATKKIKSIKRVKIEMCKKHYTSLVKKYKVAKPYDMLSAGGLGTLYGVPIFIVPGLKKVRIYKEK